MTVLLDTNHNLCAQILKLVRSTLTILSQYNSTEINGKHKQNSSTEYVYNKTSNFVFSYSENGTDCLFCEGENERKDQQSVGGVHTRFYLHLLSLFNDRLILFYQPIDLTNRARFLRSFNVTHRWNFSFVGFL